MRKLNFLSILMLVLFFSCGSQKEWSRDLKLDGTGLLSHNKIEGIYLFEYSEDSLKSHNYCWENLKPSSKFLSSSEFSRTLSGFVRSTNVTKNKDTLSLYDSLITLTKRETISKKIQLNKSCKIKFIEIYTLINNNCYDLRFGCFNDKFLTLDQILKPNSIYKFTFIIPDGLPVRNETDKVSIRENIFLYTDDKGDIYQTRYSFNKIEKIRQVSQFDRL